MKPSLERRLSALEADVATMAARWYTLSRWRSARADALTLTEREARDLAEFRDDADAIRRHYAEARAIRAEVDETLATFEATNAPK